MSIHSSLKVAGTMRRHRSVLSRLERVKILEERGSLDHEGSSFFHLPKVKHLKIRIRKEKAAGSVATEGAAGGAPEGASPAASGKGIAKTAAATTSKPTGGASAKTEGAAPAKKKE